MVTAIIRWKIGLLVGHSIAIVTTSLRLGHRARRRQLSWDDLLAFLSLVMVLVILLLYVLLPVNGHSIEAMQISHQAISSWFTIMAHATAVWTTRLSIALTILRILPNGRRFMSKVTCVAFATIWLTVVIQKLFICGSRPVLVPICRYTRLTGILEVVTDMIGDLWLVLWPAHTLLKIKLREQHGRLLLACFSCVLLGSVTTIVHAAYILRNNKMLISMTAHVQVAVYSFICNLLVVVPWVCRMFGSLANDSDDNSDRKTPSLGKTIHKTADYPNSVPTGMRYPYQLSQLGSTFNQPSKQDTARSADAPKLVNTSGRLCISNLNSTQSSFDIPASQPKTL